MLPRRAPLVYFLISFSLLAGCDRQAPEPERPVSTPVTTVNDVDPALKAATDEAWQLGGQTLQKTLEACNELHQQLTNFLTQPDSDGLEVVRQSWRHCHNEWHRLDPLLALTESNPGLFAQLQKHIFSIEARPLQPGYLDYLEAYPYSGIVNDISLRISATTLRSQHGLTDASDISLGFHALEFLLWGEQGQRPADDFHLTTQPSDEQREAGFTTADLPNNRRRDLVVLLSQLLQDDLQQLRDQWHDPNSSLYQSYHQLHPASRLQLLKNAAQQYLRRANSEALARQTVEAHTPFAGGSQEPFIEGLEGLRDLLTHGQAALAQWLGGTEHTTQWLTDLDNAISQLDRDETPDDDELEQLQQQLQQLAEFLSEPAPLSPSP